VAHELAHQWFGDAISIAAWDDVWLSEGFATYYSTRYCEEWRKGGDLAGAMEAMQEKVLRDPLLPERAVVERPPADLDAVLNAMTYQKGACVLHALRRYAGEEAFARGIRAHVARNFNESIRTSDFAAAFSAGAGMDCTRFLAVWTREKGAPLLQARVEGTRATIEQMQPGAVFPCVVDVDLVVGGAPIRKEARFETNRSVALDADGASIERVVIDPEHWVLHQELGR